MTFHPGLSTRQVILNPLLMDLSIKDSMTVWTEAFYSLYYYFYPEYVVHLAATVLLTLLYWVGEGLHKDCHAENLCITGGVMEMALSVP